jgi:hypothetical protein
LLSQAEQLLRAVNLTTTAALVAMIPVQSDDVTDVRRVVGWLSDKTVVCWQVSENVWVCGKLSGRDE